MGVFRTVVLLVLAGVSVKASTLQKAYDCLERYDYFKARELFYSCLTKEGSRAAAGYGLAMIYYRNDNPFHHTDSAVKYVNRGFAYYRSSAIPFVSKGFTVDSLHFRMLADSIAARQLRKLEHRPSVDGYEAFLRTQYLASAMYRKAALFQRDELAFNTSLAYNRSDCTGVYMKRYPQSMFLDEARVLFDRQVYDEQTKSNTEEAFVLFLSRYPRNMMASAAYEKLFTSYREKQSTRGLAFFVKTYPYAPQCMDAWKLLFSLSVKDYSYSELKRFLEDYPDFPLKNSIFKELELNKLELYAYQLGDYIGFTDKEGKMAVPAVYDAVTEFHEGLSVVSKNDTVFFMNKEGANAFGKYFSEAQVFNNGIAAVKQQGKWFFINRQGQSISALYDEINELSNSIYVVVQNGKYGALDAYGKTVIEPRFDKMGDFKNGFAYFVENGLYGFISTSGVTQKPEFDWISDFNEDQVAIVKQEKGFGLIHASGKRLLPAEYDQIFKTGSSFFMVVKNGSYAYVHSSGCFICPLMYDFMKDKAIETYTDGKFFKLIRKGKTSWCDENGVVVIPANQYDDVYFISENLIRVKRNNLYGFLDRKLILQIPIKYESAEDFSDSLALVSLKEKTCFINYKGEETLCSSSDMERLSRHYFLMPGEKKYIVNRQGQVVLQDVWQVQKPNAHTLIATLLNGEIKLLTD